MGRKEKVICGGVFVVAVLVPSIIMLSCSFASLGQTEVGLDYSAISKRVDSQVYQSGLHFLGLGHKFIKYSTQLQSIDFGDEAGNGKLLVTRTSDGLPLHLGVTFQYRFLTNQVFNLYMRFGSKQERVYRNSAENIMNSISANNSAFNFFNDKQKIAGDMQQALNLYFTDNLYATVEALQITTTDLPNSIEEAIQKTINMKQNVTQAQKKVANARVKLETKKLVAKQNADATVIAAHGQASQILAQARANALVTNQTVNTEGDSFKLSKSRLQANTSELLSYVYWDALAASSSGSNAQYLVGVDPAAYISNK